jgi:NADH-quinone oxidoreductase subunit J
MRQLGGDMLRSMGELESGAAHWLGRRTPSPRTGGEKREVESK